MSTITREWLQQTIAELEQERDATPGVVNEDAAMALQAMRIALASLEAEPVAWQWKYRDKNHVTNDQVRAKFVAQDGDVTVQPLYTAPPAPVSVPDAIHSQGENSVGDDYYALGWNAYRAAMLLGGKS